MKRCFYFVFAGVLFASVCTAQIRIIPVNIEDWVKKNFIGQGIIVGNVKYSANQQSIATFTSSPNALQISKGLILSTGYAGMASGVNNRYNLSKAFADMKSPQTDKDLSKLISAKLYDIALVEFDFVPLANSLQFNYQFGSDEYPEYVGSVFNDIFAFFVSDETSVRNIALVPGKDTPVSINTVNSKTEPDYYLDNNVFSEVVLRKPVSVVKKTYHRTLPGRIWQRIKGFFTSNSQQGYDRTAVRPDPALLKKVDQGLYRNLQYDGITKKLVAQAYVQPYKQYHLKIIIADASDNVYDSGVFIEDRSLTTKRDTLQPGFADYPDYSKLIDPQLILAGKKLEDILPAKRIPEETGIVVNFSPANTPAVTVAGSISVTKVPVQGIPLKANPVNDPNLALVEKSPEDAVIYFDFDKSVVSAEDRIKLKRVSDIYERVRNNYKIQLAGHTDNKGDLEYNIALSKRRNEAVTEILQDFSGKDSEVISATEKAYLQPAADNTTDEGRKKNRRVVISFVKN